MGGTNSTMGNICFGVFSKDTHKMEASAYRRLSEADRSNPNKLLKINQALIDKARLLGHDQKDGHPFSDLRTVSRTSALWCCDLLDRFYA